MCRTEKEISQGGFEAEFRAKIQATSTQAIGAGEEIGSPRFQSTQKFPQKFPERVGSRVQAVFQKGDKHRNVKLREEGPTDWTEPARTPIVSNPKFEVIYNLHNGKHTPMLMTHDVKHEGITTEEELKAFEANRGNFKHGFRVVVEGNIGSGEHRSS